MLAIDQSFLELVLHPKGRPPLNPKTGKPIERLPDRIEELIEEWETNNETVIVPTPALAQFLILAHHEASDYLAKISESTYFKIRSFDERAAVELAAIHVGAMTSGRKRKRGDSNATWAKVNFDRQIVAVAKVNSASIIYSDDGDMTTFAKAQGMDVVSSWDLPEPREKQAELFDKEDQEGEE
jgi:RNase H-fold protein (predicted Holliday junction resolvase)